MADSSLALNMTLNQLIQELKNSRVQDTQNPQGITEAKDVDTLAIRFYEELTEPLKELCQAILGKGAELIDTAALGDTIADAVSNMTGGSGGDDDRSPLKTVMDDFMESAGLGGPKQSAKLKPQPNHLMKVDPTMGLGFLLLYWKLDEISQKIGDGDNKKKKSGGIGSLFKGLLAGAAGLMLLAVALILFAGALILFGIVKWDAALKGMLAFALFVAGCVIIAKKVKQNLADFATFAVGVAILATGLLIFSFASLTAF